MHLVVVWIMSHSIAELMDCASTSKDFTLPLTLSVLIHKCNPSLILTISILELDIREAFNAHVGGINSEISELSRLF